MQKECSLTDTPQRSRAKFIGPGLALDNVIGEARTHMVKGEIGEEFRLLLIEGLSVRQTGWQRWRMAAATSNPFEQCPTVDDRRGTGRLASRTACWCGLIHEAHEGHERHKIGRFGFGTKPRAILG